MKPIRTWIVVADGARARIFLQEGKVLNPAPIHETSVALAPSHEIGSDRPGKGHASAARRHGMQPKSDPHLIEKERFAQTLAAHVDRAAETGSFDRLILVAPPKTLGVLRDCLSKAASGMVANEVSKDLTHVAPHDLPGHLEKAIAI